MFYEVKQYPDFELIGFSKRFSGYPFGDERNKRENDFFSSTRAKQWLLIGASSERENDYEIITAGENSKSYDFFIGYKVDEWTKKALFDQTITGVDLSPFEFFIRKIRGGLYATFKVSGASVIRNYQFLREEIASCFDGEFSFVPGPEIVIYHWRCDKDQRSIEVRLPVNKG